MTDGNFGKVVETLLNGLEGFATAKTSVGEPIEIDGTIMIPLVDVSIGVGAGAAAAADKKKNREGGGMGAKLSPSAILIIKDGSTRVINIKNQTTAMKVMDIVPDVINRFVGKTKITDPKVAKEIKNIKEAAE